MQKINEIIIVEGIHDIAFLKTFLDAVFIKTDGTSIPSETIELINNYKAQGKEFIILTDPDYPGTMIRNKLLEIVPDAKVGFVDKEKAKTTKKVGIEHSNEEEIMKVLNNLITFSNKKDMFTKNELFQLGLDGQDGSSIKREKVSKILGIGKCNSKQFLNRLNSLNKTKEEIISIIEGVN